jgi:hypothetical protein
MVKGTTIAAEQEAGRHVDTMVSYHHIFQRKHRPGEVLSAEEDCGAKEKTRSNSNAWLSLYFSFWLDETMS